MKYPCKYCGKRIDTRGMMSHVHFRHVDYVAREFALNPAVWAFMWAIDPRLNWRGNVLAPVIFTQKQLPAPNPLTVYSTQPLGYMARPIPEHRRPKGYC